MPSQRFTPLPRGWPNHIKSGLLHAISLKVSRGVFFYELNRRIVLRVCDSQQGSVAATYLQDPSIFGL